MRTLAAALLLTVAMLVGPSAAAAAMTIDAGPEVSVNGQHVTVWWHSSDTGSSELAWDTQAHADFGDYPNSSVAAGDRGTLHSGTISFLGPGTYWVKARTTGVAGTATSASRKVTVAADTEVAPTAGSWFNGTIETVAKSPDGTAMYVGGSFTAARVRSGQLGLLDPGSTGARRAGRPVVNGDVLAIVADGVGGAIIGGSFTRVGGLERGGLARLLPDGGVDPHWDASTDGTVSALSVHDGSVYVGGSYTSIDGFFQPRLAKVSLAPDDGGVLDAVWAPNPDAPVTSIRADANGVFVGGTFSTIGGQTRFSLAKLDPAGTGAADALWDPAPVGGVSVLTSDGTDLFVGGTFTTIGGQAIPRLAKLSATGTGAPDAGWVPAPNGAVSAFDIAATDMYVGGAFTTIGGQSRNRIARITTTGAGLADAGWNPNADAAVSAIEVAGASVYAGGAFTTIGGQSRSRVALLAAVGGAADATWNPNADAGSVNALHHDGTDLLVGGSFQAFGQLTRNRIAKLSGGGQLDETWNPNADGTVLDIAVDATGAVFAGGQFANIGGQSRSRIAKLSPTGTGAADATWNANATGGDVNELLVADTTLYAAGAFTNIGGQGRNRIAALATTGTGAATTWNPNSNNTVHAITYSEETGGAYIYAGGEFTTIGGASRNRIAKLPVISNTADATWNPGGSGADAIVHTLLVSGTALYAGGTFSNIGGSGRNRIAKLVTTTTGAVDGTWNPNVTGTHVWTMSLDGGLLYLGGNFTQVGGTSRASLARVSTSSTGALDSSWNPAPNGLVNELVRSGTVLHLGGAFTTIAGVTTVGRYGAIRARSNGDIIDVGPLSITQAPAVQQSTFQNTVTWTTSGTSSSELVWDRRSRSAWSLYANEVSNTATALGTVHSRTISNLPAGTYHYRVRSTNAAGEQVTSSEQTFTVAAALGSTPLNSTMFNETVQASDFSADGTRIYLGGSFTRVGTRSGQGVSVDPSSGTVRAGGPQVVGQVNATIPDGAGGWYVGGEFQNVGGYTRRAIAHILPDGGVDPAWSPAFVAVGSSANITNLASDGTYVYAVGTFTHVNGSARTRIARVSIASGAFDATWDPNPNGAVNVVFVNGTDVWAGGTFTTIGGASKTNLAKMSTSSSAAVAGFTSSPDGAVEDLAYHAATGLYVAGSFANIGGQARAGIARVSETTGVAVAAFNVGITGGGGANSVEAMTVGGSPALYVGGAFTGTSAPSRAYLARVNVTTGAVDSTFNPGPNSSLNELANDGSHLYPSGAFTSIGGRSRSFVARIDTISGAATVFDAGAPDQVRAVAASATSGVFLGNSTAFWGGVARSGLAAIDAETGELLEWAPAVTGAMVHAIEVVGTDVYVGGDFSNVGGTARANAAKVSAAGVVDGTWNPAPNSTVLDLHYDGASLLAAGQFTTIGGQSRNFVAKLATSGAGAADGTWNPNANTTVSSIAQSGSDVYLGGAFATVSGQAHTRVAKVSGSGTGAADAGFTASANQWVYGMAVEGSDLILAGSFSALGAVSTTGFGKVDAATGAPSATFVSNPSFPVPFTGVQVVGSRLVLGGTYNMVLDLANPQTLKSTTPYVIETNSVSGFTVGPGALSVSGDRVFFGGTSGNASFGDVGGSGLAVDATQGTLVLNPFVQGPATLLDLCPLDTAFCGDEPLREYVTLGVDSTTELSAAPAGTSSVGTTSVTVESNAFNGYSLYATDVDTGDGPTCTTGACTGEVIADWTGTDASPTTWPETGADYGFGVTVLRSQDSARLAKWGTGTTALDFADSLYAGLGTSPTLLHSTNRFHDLSDTTVLAWRARATPTQAPGDYSSHVTLTVVANP